MYGSDDYSRAADPRQKLATTKVRDWYDQHYGSAPVQTDDTGKVVASGFTTEPQKQPVAAMGHDGQPVMDGIMGAGAKIADLAGKRGLSTAIRGVQSGLNMINRVQADGRTKTGSLKIDGLFGSKTKQSFRNSVAEQGRHKVENALALGSFQNLLENKRGQALGDLGEVAHDSFSGLFQNAATFKPEDKSPKPWGVVLQDTINDVGTDTFGKDTFKPLKTDGWIGPKTSSAFASVFKPTGMGGFMKSLGSNFGFF